MAATQVAKPDGATRLIGTIEEMERSALESVRTFVDTVDGVFPDVGDDHARRRVIDGAFKMVEQIVGASNRLATNVVTATERALAELDRDGAVKATPAAKS
jgi:hypothetical protein